MKYNDDGTIQEIKVKAFDTLPVGTEVDYDGTTVPSGYVQVADPNTYSTDEVRIGTWINGKPLYRKTFVYENLSQISSGSYGTINTGLSNVNVIKIEGINESQDICRMLPFSLSGYLINILTVNNGANIRIYINGTFTTINDNAIITLEYTKTTD